MRPLLLPYYAGWPPQKTYLAQILKSDPSQQALSFVERLAAPHFELLPFTVRALTSAAPFPVTVTETTRIPSSNGFSLKSDRLNDPSASGIKRHLPLKATLPAV